LSRTELQDKILALESQLKEQGETEKERHKVRLLEKRIQQVDEDIQDIRSTRNVTSSEDADESTLQAATEKLNQLKEELSKFEGEANEFEADKRKACSGSSKLQEAKDKISNLKKQLSTIEENIMIKQKVVEVLSLSARQIIKRRIEMQDQGDAITFKNAKSLDILLFQNNGEMLLNDWKQEIADQLQSSKVNVIPIVYGLVANSLVSIDRQVEETRVLSMLR